MQEIRRLTQFADEYEDDLVKEMIGHLAKTAACERSLKQTALDGLLARDKELNTHFERLYEDNVSGKINDERFAKMSKKYEQKQGENAAKVKALKSELRKTGGQTVQCITIFYNCIGAFTVPERESIPEADVRLKNEKRSSTKLLPSKSRIKNRVSLKDTQIL